MQIKVTGKNFDVGNALRGHVVDRVGEVMAKLFQDGFTGHVVMEREGPGFRTECSVQLDSGVYLHTRGEQVDPYASFDQAAERLEKRLRRYKRRLKNHHDARLATDDLEGVATSFILVRPDEEGDDGEPEGLNPLIVAESPVSLRRLSVGEAVMEMDLADIPVMLFHNASSGALNVVYRRDDGNIGWIDPERGLGNGKVAR